MKKLLNWFLCHTVILAVLLFIAAGYYFRQAIFAMPLSADAAGAAASLSITQPESTPAAATDDAAELSAEPVKQAVQQPLTANSQEPPALPEPPSLLATESTSPETLNTQVASSKAVGQVKEPAAIEFPEEAKDTPEKIIAQQDYQFRPPASEAEQISEVQTDLLQKARQAYWNDQLDKAASLYRAYIEIHPANPDGYGELGNLLSTTGDLAEAALMYAKAAELLLQQGRIEQAAKLREVLDSIEIIQNSSN